MVEPFSICSGRSIPEPFLLVGRGLLPPELLPPAEEGDASSSLPGHPKQNTNAKIAAILSDAENLYKLVFRNGM